MGRESESFTIEYRFVPSTDAQERLDQAYTLILDLSLAALQNPEEDAAGAFPDAADAGGQFLERHAVKSSQLGVSHAG